MQPMIDCVTTRVALEGKALLFQFLIEFFPNNTYTYPYCKRLRACLFHVYFIIWIYLNYNILSLKVLFLNKMTIAKVQNKLYVMFASS